MRLALVVYGSLQRRTGGNLYDRHLLDWLEERGHEVREVPLDGGSYLRHLCHNLEGAWVERLAAERWDLILQDELVHPSLFRLNRRLRRSAGAPIVSIVHHLRSSEPEHPWLLRPLYRGVERRYLETVDAFVFNSRNTRLEVESLLGRATRGMIARPGGDRLGSVDDEATLVARALEPGPLRVVFVGNLIARKNLETLLRALASVEADWSLDVVGAGVDEAYARGVQALTRELGLAQRVRFRGALADDELAARLAASHVLAVPSTWEGFGIVYLEGMAFGLPAIASTGGAAGEVVAEGETGFLVPPDDEATLAQRLQSLARDRHRLAEMAIAARRHFLGQPRWRDTAATIEAYLEDVWIERRAALRRRAEAPAAR